MEKGTQYSPTREPVMQTDTRATGWQKKVEVSVRALDNGWNVASTLELSRLNPSG